MSTTSHESTRARLHDERAELLAAISQLGVSNDGPQAFDDNFADSAQVAAEQGEARLLAAQLEEQMAEIDAALARLDEGTYGVCSVCSKPIGEARLEAMPMATLCIDHAG